MGNIFSNNKRSPYSSTYIIPGQVHRYTALLWGYLQYAIPRSPSVAVSGAYSIYVVLVHSHLTNNKHTKKKELF